MALIPDLPASSALSSTDVFVMDTGSATKKITASDLATELGKQIVTSADTSSISGVQLRRSGKVVSIFLRGANVNSSGSIGTIPADYRPSAYLYANCVHTAAGGVVRPAQITIENSGTTQINTYNGSNNYGLATNGRVNGTITFVIN